MTTPQATVDFDVRAADEAIGVRPETSIRLMRLAADEKTEPEDLQEVIDSDPSMAMRTLKLANSAFYGMRHKVARIDRAITLLGMSTVAKLAASSSMESAFKDVKIDAPGVNAETPWRYSLSVAYATETIVKEIPSTTSVAAKRLGAEAFVTGLIHDIGTLVQAKLSTEKFAQAVNASLRTGLPLVAQERRIVGIDHADIGMRLAEHWELPEGLVNGIGFHHEPEAAEPEHRVLACVIHVAAQLVRRADVASFDGDTDTPLVEGAMSHLRLDPRRIDQLVTAIKARLKNATF